MSSRIMDDDWGLPNFHNEFNLVLFGKTGNGKSATGNSILGKEAFLSKTSLFSVTSTCQLQRITLRDGRRVNVIDTPGLFDSSDEVEATGREIVRCVNLAKDGIHAILMVFSVRSRFSAEEEAAIESLKSFFGEKILDYTIVVFTGGDDLENNEQSLKDFIGHKKHKPLQKFLESCKSRIVLFDNKTKDEAKRTKQLESLFYLVDSVVSGNGGKPFSDELFDKLKKGALSVHCKEKEVESKQGYSEQQISELKEQISKSCDVQLERITKMVEQKLKLTAEKLEKQLAEEQAARLEAEKRSDKEIKNLEDKLLMAQKDAEEIKMLAECEGDYTEDVIGDLEME